MLIYESADLYIESASTIKDKIAKIDSVITALLNVAAKSATTDNLSEYWLDDGQTKIKTVYKGTDAVLRSVQSFEKLRQFYIVQYNKSKTGSIVRLVDSKNFNNGRHGF